MSSKLEKFLSTPDNSENPLIDISDDELSTPPPKYISKRHPKFQEFLDYIGEQEVNKWSCSVEPIWKDDEIDGIFISFSKKF